MTDTIISSATREVVIGFDRPFVIIGERINPEPPKQLPGMPPRAQMIAELMRAMEQAAKKG